MRRQEGGVLMTVQAKMLRSLLLSLFGLCPPPLVWAQFAVSLTFAISALGLAQSSPLYAQNQSRPQAVACPIEGPPVADTLKYINDALASDNRTDIVDVISVQKDRLFQIDHVSGIGEAQSAAVYALNCQSLRGTVFGERFEVDLECHAGNCFEAWVQDNPQASWRTRGSAGAMAISFNCDNEKGRRLVQALSHLIALLQQQYKQSHSDPSDPFAKPQ
jgi:hypothetical protein